MRVGQRFRGFRAGDSGTVHRVLPVPSALRVDLWVESVATGILLIHTTPYTHLIPFIKDSR